MRKPIFEKRSLIIGLSLVFLLLLALCLFSLNAGRYAVAAITAVYAGLSFYFLKKTPFSSVHRRAVLFVTVIVAVLYTALLLLSGLRFGFHLADVAFSGRSFLSYILPIAITVISTEMIRGSLLGQKGMLSWSVAYAVGVLAEILLVTTFSAVTNFYHFMDLVGMALLPAVAAQPLYQYTGKHYGALPAIAYRLITALSPFLIPIRSGMPDSLSSFLSLFVPPVLLLLLRLLYGKSVQATGRRPVGKWMYAVSIALAALALSYIMLISCQFRYGVLIIATDSMTGSINKGDAVLYEEYTGQYIGEEDVIIFYHDDRVTVHRVVEIAYINGGYRYYTKGDANDARDHGYASSQDIIGVTKATLPYFGYPTLWLRGLFQ